MGSDKKNVRPEIKRRRTKETKMETRTLHIWRW